MNSKARKFYFENLKMFCVLIFININQVSNDLKKLYKNGITWLMTKNFDVLYVSGIK